MAGALTTTRRGRHLAALAVVLAVVLAHWWLSARVSDMMADASRAAQPAVKRMDVAFVRELAPTEPAPVVAAAPPPPRRRSAAPVAAVPASAPASAVPAPVTDAASSPASPEAADEPAPAETDTAVADSSPAASSPSPALADAASEVAASASTAAVAASAPASAASAVAFEWPPSTRLDYVLTGNYRGEVNGNARVQWIRDGSHYQVQVDVVIGPSFAPLVARRMTSDGEITVHGLEPLRYEEETTAMFGKPRRRAVRFEPDRIVLDRGTAGAWPGVQDTASQFVQLTWLFTTQPQVLQVGRSLDFPLALPRRVDRWFYDVVAEETLHTRIGEVRTFHVKPRRDSVRPGELTAELWVAPSFQYLPVRIVIRQEGDTYVDLLVHSPPMQTP